MHGLLVVLRPQWESIKYPHNTPLVSGPGLCVCGAPGCVYLHSVAMDGLGLEEGVGSPAGGSPMLAAAPAVCRSSDVTPLSGTKTIVFKITKRRPNLRGLP